MKILEVFGFTLGDTEGHYYQYYKDTPDNRRNLLEYYIARSNFAQRMGYISNDNNRISRRDYCIDSETVGIEIEKALSQLDTSRRVTIEEGWDCCHTIRFMEPQQSFDLVFKEPEDDDEDYEDDDEVDDEED